MSFDLSPYIGKVLRLRTLPLGGGFTVGLYYKVHEVHDSWFTVEDDLGRRRRISFSWFDLSTTR